MRNVRRRMSERGAALMLIAVGLSVALGGYVLVIQTTSQINNRQLRHFSNSVDGFYWPELALVQADFLDQKAIAAATAAGTTSPHQKKKNTKFVRKTVRTTISVAHELTEPLTLKANVDENLSFSIPGGLPPKEICGELAGGKNGYRVCAFRTPDLDTTGLAADVLACARKWTAAGVMPFTNAQLRTPRRVNLGSPYLAMGGYSDLATTAAPELVVITVTGLISLAVNLNLKNPNGYYCLSLGSAISIASGAQVDCHAHLVTADSRTVYDILPRSAVTGTCQ